MNEDTEMLLQWFCGVGIVVGMLIGVCALEYLFG